jgi:hypothetical protein
MLMENDRELVCYTGMGLATPSYQLACEMHLATRGPAKQETCLQTFIAINLGNPDLFIVPTEYTVKSYLTETSRHNY